MKTKVMLFSLIFISLIGFISADSLVIENFSDYGVDYDGNGLYDSLIITIAANFSGDYSRFEGELRDINNQTVAYVGFKLYDSQNDGNMEGYYELIAHIDGRKLYLNGADGEYTLTNMKVCQMRFTNCSLFSEEYQTASYNHTAFEIPEIIFLDILGEETPDQNNNSLYDSLNINVLVNVTEADEYRVYANLESFEGENIAEANGRFYLEQGIQNIILEFPGYAISANEINGPYHLDYFSYQSESNDDGFSYNINYTTQQYNYSEFEPPLVQIIGNFTEEAIDVNNNSLYDSLKVSFDISISEMPGELRHVDIHLTLRDENGMYVSSGREIFNENIIGIQRVEVYFPGLMIQERGLNGPYHIRAYIDVDFYDLEELEWRLENIYTTNNYTYDSFERRGAEMVAENIVERLGEVNGDGFYDLLITVPINVTEQNYYELEAEVDQLNGDYSILQYLDLGMQEITIAIYGQEIFEEEYNGYYEIEDLELAQFIGGDYENSILYYPIQGLDNYQTDFYNYTDFVVRGDVNSDGEITLADVLRIVDIILERVPEPTEFELISGDLNYDDTINIIDVVMLINKMYDTQTESIGLSSDPFEVDLREYHGNLGLEENVEYEWEIIDIDGPIKARLYGENLKIYAEENGRGTIKLELTALYNGFAVGQNILEILVKSTNVKKPKKDFKVKYPIEIKPVKITLDPEEIDPRRPGKLGEGKEVEEEQKKEIKKVEKEEVKVREEKEIKEVEKKKFNTKKKMLEGVYLK